MRFPQPLRRGRLVRRYKRFLAEVVLDGQTDETTVHVPNPGAMLGLDAPDSTVWLSRDDRPSRKLPLTLEYVESAGAPVGVNTLLANRLAAEALEAGVVAELAGYATIRREVRYGEASRVDFLLEAPDRPACWVEVKSVTLARAPGLVEWPDCRSTRAKHLAELEAMAAAGDRAVVLFIAQRGDGARFDVAADLDPAFAAALERATGAGVEVLCYSCELDPGGARVTMRIPRVAAGRPSA